MKKGYLIFLIVFITITTTKLFSLNNEVVSKISKSFHYNDGNISNDTIIKDTLSINRVPEFPGGQEALNAYFKANLKYPKRAKEMNIQGRVIVNLTISSQGKISKIAIFKGLFPDCDEEAYYLIKKMPKWNPGIKNGQPATMDVMLPISFELN